MCLKKIQIQTYTKSLVMGLILPHGARGQNQLVLVSNGSLSVLKSPYFTSILSDLDGYVLAFDVMSIQCHHPGPRPRYLNNCWMDCVEFNIDLHGMGPQ